MRKMIIAVRFYYERVDEDKLKTPDDITKYLQAKGWKIWHWVENVWLLNGVPDSVTPKILWEDIKVGVDMPSLNGIVLDPRESTYWGNLPREAWAWMLECWGVPENLPSPPLPWVAPKP